MLFGIFPCRCVFFNRLFKFLCQKLKADSGVFFAASSHDIGHVIEQVKAAQWGRLMRHKRTGFQPCCSGSVRPRTGILKLLFVEFFPGKFFQLFNRIVELSDQVVHFFFGDINRIGKRNVDHDERNVMHTRNIFVPFGHHIADIVTAQQKVGLRHSARIGGFSRGIRKTDTGITADIVIISHIFRSLAKAQSVFLSSCRCCMVFGIHNIKIKSFR